MRCWARCQPWGSTSVRSSPGPRKGRLGDYIFYIDVQGHILDERVADAVGELEKMAFVRVLGSYPRQY